LGGIGQVDDHRIIGWAALGFEDGANGFGRKRVSAEAINRFGGQSDEAAGPQNGRGAFDSRGVCG
jgi:hypothetical protein